jgi:hypothetical protein
MSEYNEGHGIELVDRISTVVMMIDELLIDHPAAIEFNLNAKIEAVGLTLAGLYQEAGAAEFDKD